MRGLLSSASLLLLAHTHTGAAAVPPLTRTRLNNVVPHQRTANAPALRGAQNLTDGCTTSTNYDFFLLVTQWPVSQCKDSFSCQTSDLFFTLHGLWPNDYNGDYPCTCTNEQFDPSAVASLSTQMNTYWPSFNGPNDDFWAHEYTKHGTCAEDVLPNELAFFSAALQYRAQYDILAALNASSIVPSDSQGFSMKAFKNATTVANGYAASVQCDSSGNILVTQVCLSKSGQPIQCPSSVTDDCNSNTLYLPVTV